MERNSKTISVSDKISSLEGKIDDVLEEAEDVPADSERYEDLDIQFKSHSIERDKFESIAEDINSDEFTIEELSFGELMMVRDEVMSVSDQQNPREGLYQVKILESAVSDSPDELEDDPKEWPPVIAEWVYDEVDSMNTGVDEETLGNYSMEEALENR